MPACYCTGACMRPPYKCGSYIDKKSYGNQYGDGYTWLPDAGYIDRDLTPFTPIVVKCPCCDGWGTRQIYQPDSTAASSRTVECPACEARGYLILDDEDEPENIYYYLQATK